jgi:hypothetical protein
MHRRMRAELSSLEAGERLVRVIAAQHIVVLWPGFLTLKTEIRPVDCGRFELVRQLHWMLDS